MTHTPVLLLLALILSSQKTLASVNAAVSLPQPILGKDALTVDPLASRVSIQYTTDGEVTLSVMNITFVTTELHVVLLGCDVGNYDHHALYPPEASWKTEVTPFDCRECVCEDNGTAESIRAEPFIVV